MLSVTGVWWRVRCHPASEAAQPVWRGCCSAACKGHRAEKKKQRGGPSPPSHCLHTRGLSNYVHVTSSGMRVGKTRARAAVDVIPRKHPRWDLPSALRARTAQAQSEARCCRSWRALGQPNRPPDPPPEANFQPAVPPENRLVFAPNHVQPPWDRETPRCWGWGQPRREGMDLSRW